MGKTQFVDIFPASTAESFLLPLFLHLSPVPLLDSMAHYGKNSFLPCTFDILNRKSIISKHTPTFHEITSTPCKGAWKY
jgi:hypothetical protein